MPERRPWVPPHYFLLALLCMAVLHWFWPVTQVVQWPLRWLGVVPVVSGLWVAVQASQVFKVRGTAIRPFETSSVLVTDGWFRFSRNPMYVSMLVLLIGVAILLGSASAFVPVPLLATVLRYRFIRVEEKMMRETFGEAYAEYCRKVRRWL